MTTLGECETMNTEEKRRRLEEDCKSLVKRIRRLRDRDKVLVFFIGLGACFAFYFFVKDVSKDTQAITVVLIFGFTFVIQELMEIQACILGSQLQRLSDELDNLPERPEHGW